MQENRKRKKQIKFRLDEDEFRDLKEKVKKSGLTQEAYLRSMIKKSKIITAPPVEYYKYINALNEQITELKRIGNNLNQLAARLNSSQTVSESSIDETIALLDLYIQKLMNKVEEK